MTVISMHKALRILIDYFKKDKTEHSVPVEDKKMLGELDQFGASLGELEKALDKITQWIATQPHVMEELQYPVQAHQGTRVFHTEEIRKISKKSLGFIVKMENMGVVTPSMRENVLDELMQLREGEASLSRTKWITFQTLFHTASPTHIAYLEWLLFGKMARPH